MLLRRLHTQTPRTERTVARSWSTAHLSRHFHGKTQTAFKYRGVHLRFEFQQSAKQQQLSRSYSNYAPRGPPPYSTYIQQPRSRASRLKDMAIGSILTIAVYLTYEFYVYRQIMKEMKEDEVLGRTLNELLFHYAELLDKAEANGDDAEKIRALVMERAKAVALLSVDQGHQGEPVEDLGPLPRLPEGQALHGKEKIEDEDTLVLFPPQPDAEELAKLDKEARKRGEGERTEQPVYTVFIAINAFSEDLGLPGPGKEREMPKSGAIDSGEFKFGEVLVRSGFMIDGLCSAGTLEPDRRALVTILLRDDVWVYTYRQGTFERVRADWWQT
ncbi:hypothetical protein HD806DRAFT_500307 [Xylariaceae sp. AK1471]|nr:hypothetical protein HD806DRAFT_500307 [Xylariaceae sp. AK1471]